jgi:ligand-binding sensor domain-containing protein
MDARWLPIGLPTRGAAAIAIAGDDVWIGGDAAGRGGGIARTSKDLTRWAVFRSDDGAPTGLVREIATGAGLVWVAAADGLYRLEAAAVDNGQPERAAWRRITAADGLPTDRVAGIAAVAGGLWAATTQGLAFVTADGAVAPFTIAPGLTIARAVAMGDTLWVASAEGVLVVPNAGHPTILPGELVNVPQARPPAAFAAPGTDGHPLLRGPIVDIAAGDAGIVALAGGALFRYDGARWIGPDRGAGQAGIGRPIRVRADGRRIWVAGERGAAVLDIATGGWTSYLVPADVPAGPVVDVASDGEHVWLATPLGALRLRIRS